MAKIADYNSVLCHYTTSATAFEAILVDRKLRFSPYARMRDPTESQRWRFGAAFSPDSFQGREDEAQTHGLAQRAADELKRQTKLLALTADASSYEGRGFTDEMFGRGWARARMWEQYGENHRGACLIFDREILHRELTEGLRTGGVMGCWEGQVSYTRSGVAGAIGALSFRLDNFKTKPMEEALSDHLEQHYRDLFLLKTLDWESEHEYRYVAHKPDDDYLYIPFSDSLKAVIVGARFPAWQASGALKSCELVGATAYRLKWLHEGPLPVDLDRD
jgi:Protein of unknown function (DUF2971)